jgi:hypothetical protein
MLRNQKKRKSEEKTKYSMKRISKVPGRELERSLIKKVSKNLKKDNGCRIT